MKAACLSDHRLAVSSPIRMLKRIFGETNVDLISGNKIDAVNIKRYQLLFLPGIWGENSICDELLPTEQRDVTLNEIRNSGLVVWAECCWAYRISHAASYRFDDGTNGRWQGYGWADMETEGPVTQSSNSLQLSDITLYHPQGPRDLQVCCHSGPGFLPNRDNEDIKIIAEYRGLKKDYIAALSQKCGNGLILAQGVLPEITFTHSIGSYANEDKEKHRVYLEKSLRENDEALICFQDYMIEQAMPYMRERHARIA